MTYEDSLFAESRPHRSNFKWRKVMASERQLAGLALLDGLEEIPWGTLHHAYGAAEDVPALLRKLLSDMPRRRSNAIRSLFGTIWHQGTVYEASAYAVPFLLRLLADTRTPNREDIAHLLLVIATGSSYLAVHHREDDTGSNWRTLLAEDGKDFDTELQQELAWVRAANEAVAEGLELLFRIAQDRDEHTRLRREALATIASLPTRADESIPRLLALLHTRADLDPLVQVCVARALYELMDDSPASQQFFTDLLHTQEDAIRLIGAVGVLTRAREHAPNIAVESALEVVGELGVLPHHYGASPENQSAWQATRDRFYPAWYPDPLRFILTALKGLGAQRAKPVLLRAFRLLHNSEDAEELAIMLLALSFSEEQPVEYSRSLSWDKVINRGRIQYWSKSKHPSCQANDLTAGQREVLAALADHDPLWEHQSNLLEMYGLPPEQEALHTLLTADHPLDK